jgi:hypothetical protein
MQRQDSIPESGLAGHVSQELAKRSPPAVHWDSGSSEPMNNFTPRAQQTLALARQEADRFHHNFVGTEHLLLGLIRLGQGTAVNVLNQMELDLEILRLEVEKQVGTGPDQMVVGVIPFTPRVKKVLALAAKEAKALNHTYVGTEHILLGLLREGDGVAARVLKNLDVDIEVTRQNVLKELDPNFVGAPEDQTTMQKHEPSKPPSDSIDTSKRYDVYCKEDQAVVVYRNVLFRDRRRLLAEGKFATSCEFLQIEHVDGSTVYISAHSVIKFCEHGVNPNPEKQI